VNISRPVHTVVTFAGARQVLDGLIWPATADRSGGRVRPRDFNTPRGLGAPAPRLTRSVGVPDPWGGQGSGHANQLPHPNGDGGARQGLALGTAALRMEVPCR
jgi:hypothetical protein